MSETVQPLSRRERVRVETVREILDTARRVLVEQGTDGLALRAVAREMGVTAPALYRYFDSREDLVENVVADLYTELCDFLEEARDAARPADPAVQVLAASRAFRAWATAHSAEFGLLFGSPVAGVVPKDLHGSGEGPAHEAAQRFGAVFAELVSRLYLSRPFPVPDEADLEPALRTQLREWCHHFPADVPLGVLQVFLSCWIRLYGIVCLEIFGHLKFALSDAEPMFEAELRSLGAVLGVGDEYREP